MYSFEKRKEIVNEIGNFLRNYLERKLNYSIQYNFDEVIENEKNYNFWFTKENVLYAIKYWAEKLTLDNLEFWLKKYEPEIKKTRNKNVCIICAGNIPLVSLHDILCSFLSGFKTIVKLSKKDNRLLKFIFNFLYEKYYDLINHIRLLDDEFINDFDIVIATGNNNTIRYFDYYFGKYPHIFRGHKNSIAILFGDETIEDLNLLSDDIFIYFGLGCRNVSKIYIPYNYDFNNFFKALEKWSKLYYYYHYYNNYSYHKAIFSINKEKFLDNGFLLLKENKQITSPIGVLYYEFFENEYDLHQKILENKNNIQCIVCKKNILFLPNIYFGKTQKPELWEYNDNIDIIEFLLKI